MKIEFDKSIQKENTYKIGKTTYYINRNFSGNESIVQKIYKLIIDDFSKENKL